MTTGRMIRKKYYLPMADILVCAIIQQGMLTHKVVTVQTGDGREKIVENVLVTPKGLAKLAATVHAKEAQHAA